MKHTQQHNDGEEGYPLYPTSEDIYNQYIEESEINPEDISRIKSELDYEQENIEREAEENNRYSLGGFSHNNLEEEKRCNGTSLNF
jgi:hypothetical protein